jgi:Protein of unknown function (DUF3300)
LIGVRWPISYHRQTARIADRVILPCGADGKAMIRDSLRPEVRRAVGTRLSGVAMNIPDLPQAHPVRGRRSRKLTLVLSLLAAVHATQVIAQAPAAPTAAAPVPAAAELEGLVGRIALYPDDLIGIILPASTNPLQIVQADRFLEKRKADPKAPVDDKWDDAVKSLLNYPDVVKMMSADLDWTSALGEAVVADAGEVLEAVQAFRRKTQAAGNLKTDEKQVVTVEKEVITIVQANPEVIYVPQYNPTTVVYAGYTGYGYYPTPYPVYYYPYPPGAAFATGLIWGAAIGAAWNGGHYATHYGGNNNININRNTNINTGNINTGNVNRGGQGGGSEWKSNKQPGQVSSSVGKTAPSARAGDARAGAGGAQASNRGGAQASNRAGTAGGGAGGAAGAGAARPSTQPAGSGGGRASAQPAGGGGGGGGSAFGGYDSGRQASMDSSRGASSRSSASASSTRSSPSSAGARSSGGGARAGGGGGGGRRR